MAGAQEGSTIEAAETSAAQKTIDMYGRGSVVRWCIRDARASRRTFGNCDTSAGATPDRRDSGAEGCDGSQSHPRKAGAAAPGCEARRNSAAEAISFASMFLVNMLGFIAAGINLYFLGKFLRALGWYGRKLATLLVGAGWLLVWACFSVLALAHGLSECSGGCGVRSPELLDWVFVLAMAGVGLGFSRLLSFIHSGDPAAAKVRQPRMTRW